VKVASYHLVKVAAFVEAMVLGNWEWVMDLDA